MIRDRLYKTDGIIIKRSDSGEADRLLTLYTPQLGKVRAVAKGARKMTSRLGGHVELLTLSRFMIAKGRQVDYVTQAEIVRSFVEIRDSLTLVSYAYYLAELIDQFAEGSTENEPLYDLLHNALASLASARNPDLLLRHFELHVLDLTGYRPELHHCLTCRRELEAVTNSFSAAAGGVLCPRCATGQPVRRELTVDVLKSLRFLQDNDYSRASRLNVAAALNWELEMLLGETLRHILERDVKSTAFLHTLRRQARQQAGRDALPADEENVAAASGAATG
jgi:DNA repair protein RecO (recombination protein O)